MGNRWRQWNDEIERSLTRWLGAPAPFRKMLAAFLCLLVASYIHVFPKVDPSLVSLLNAYTILVLGMASLFAGIVMLLLAILDCWRRVSFTEKFLAFSVLILGFFLLDALTQLAHEGRQSFLEAFVTILVGVLISLAVESRRLDTGRG